MIYQSRNVPIIRVAAEWNRAVEVAAHADTVVFEGTCLELELIMLGAVWEVAVGGSAEDEDR